MTYYKLFLDPLSEQIKYALITVGHHSIEDLDDLHDLDRASMALAYAEVGEPVSKAQPMLNFYNAMVHMRTGFVMCAIKARYNLEVANQIIDQLPVRNLPNFEEHPQLWRGTMLNIATDLQKVGY